MKKIIGIDFDGTCVTDLYPYVGDNIGAASGKEGQFSDSDKKTAENFGCEYMDFVEYMNDDEDEEEKIVYDTILMIGDASGKEGQFSDSDKKTAENFGCEYMDVDDFVYKYNNR